MEFFCISVCLPPCVCVMAYLRVMMHHFDKDFQAPFLFLLLYPRIHLARETDLRSKELKTVIAETMHEHSLLRIAYN